MNEGQLTDLVMERKDIPPMAKIVLRAIIRRVDWNTWTSKEGHKNVSTRELAKRCGTSLPTIIKSIARLEKAGLIERDFFKATKTQAPPIKVNVEAILKGTTDALPFAGTQLVADPGLGLIAIDWGLDGLDAVGAGLVQADAAVAAAP